MFYIKLSNQKYLLYKKNFLFEFEAPIVFKKKLLQVFFFRRNIIFSHLLAWLK